MKTIQYSAYGGPEVLEFVDVPDPKMFDDLVLVRIHAAALNPADLAFQRGAAESTVDTFFPATPGWDIAGVIERVGSATSGFRPGDEVIGYVRGQSVHYGAYAEMIAAEPRQLVRKPAALSWAAAAALPVAGLTAYQSIVNALHVGDRDTVLIHGAAGGVGHLAAQIARSRGARVVGTGSAASQEFIGSLGVEAVEYGAGLDENLRALVPQGFDAILDAAGHGSLATTAAIAAPAARVASITRSTDHPGVIDVRLRLDIDDFEELAAMAGDGRISARVARTYPLSQAAEAQRDLASGHPRGKIVLLTGAEH